MSFRGKEQESMAHGQRPRIRPRCSQAHRSGATDSPPPRRVGGDSTGTRGASAHTLEVRLGRSAIQATRSQASRHKNQNQGSLKRVGTSMGPAAKTDIARTVRASPRCPAPPWGPLSSHEPHPPPTRGPSTCGPSALRPCPHVLSEDASGTAPDTQNELEKQLSK